MSTGNSRTTKYWAAFDLGVNNVSKRPHYRRDPRKYDTNKHKFFCFSPTAKQGVEDCSDDRVSHHTYNKRFDFWAQSFTAENGALEKTPRACCMCDKYSAVCTVVPGS